jgi:hypothetical protein
VKVLHAHHGSAALSSTDGRCSGDIFRTIAFVALTVALMVLKPLEPLDFT